MKRKGTWGGRMVDPTLTAISTSYRDLEGEAREQRTFHKLMENIPEQHTIEFLKRKAKKLKKSRGYTHSDALKRVARDEGFLSWEGLVAARGKIK